MICKNCKKIMSLWESRTTCSHCTPANFSLDSAAVSLAGMTTGLYFAYNDCTYFIDERSWQGGSKTVFALRTHNISKGTEWVHLIHIQSGFSIRDLLHIHEKRTQR